MGAVSTSSSDVDDEEAERLRSVAVDSASVAGIAAALSHKKKKKKKDNEDGAAPSSLKFYQARARDFLHEYLDKTIVIKRLKYEETELPDAHFVEDAEDTGFHLFKRAPSGLSDKRHWQEEAPKRKHQDHNPDESSEMFQAAVLATAIDGIAVTLEAEKAKGKAFAVWVLHQAKEKEAKRKEEERIALLKVQRGEQWLPSVAKDMQRDSVCCSNSPMKVDSLCIEEKRCKDLQRKDANQKFKKKLSKLEVTTVK